MAIILIFLLGVGNFALHRAVVESRHPLVRQTAWFGSSGARRMSLLVEFVVLLAAMMLASNGLIGFAWAYAIYSSLNAGAAWLILSGRV